MPGFSFGFMIAACSGLLLSRAMTPERAKSSIPALKAREYLLEIFLFPVNSRIMASGSSLTTFPPRVSTSSRIAACRPPSRDPGDDHFPSDGIGPTESFASRTSTSRFNCLMTLAIVSCVVRW